MEGASQLANTRLRDISCGLGFVVLALALPSRVNAAATPADTQISNTATVQYQVGGQSYSGRSNTASFYVDELIDVSVVNNDGAGVSVSSPESGAPLSFTVTNTGNGSESYRLTATSNVSGDDFDPSPPLLIYLDDGDGVFEGSKDTLYSPGVNDPNLKAGQAIKVFVVNNIPPGLASGNKGVSDLTATALTGLGTPNQGKPGASFPGQGDGGTTAVLGPNGGTQTAAGTYIVRPQPETLQKSLLNVVDPQGGSQSEPGSVLTYQLKFSVTVPPGETSVPVATGVVIADPIPVNTTYVPGSMQLDGLVLTDAQDADAGRFTGAGIEVSLGDVTAPATRTVIFKVQIN